LLLERISCEPASALEDVTPSGAIAVEGRTTVLARLHADQARITLHYRGAAAATFEVDTTAVTATGVVDHLWAAARLEELLEGGDSQRDAILRLGRDHALVTPYTSLLVLETLEQHLEHGVLPAESRAALRAAYLEAIEKRETAATAQREQHLVQVRARWQERLAWYHKTFSYPADFRFKEQAPAKLEEQQGRDGAEGSAGEPAPAPRTVERLARRGGGAPDASGAAFAADADKKLDEPTPSGPSIALKAWDPAKPYLVPLRAAADGAAAYAAYLAQRQSHGASPAFFLDCAEHLLVQRNERELGLRVLSSLLELQIESAPLLRIVAHRLAQLGEHDRAIELFTSVRRLRPEEAQSHRDLALAYDGRYRAASAAGSAAATDDLDRALGLLAHVVATPWDDRFPDVELIALVEHNDILARRRVVAQDGAYRPLLPDDLLEALKLDVRILLTWDADATDIDLWVIEPSDEKCMYNHPLTTIGGMMTRDFTQGYGPEVYLLRQAMPGSYQIKCNFYGSNQQQLSGGVTIQATVITRFGSPEERRQTLTVRVEQKEEVIELGAIDFQR
jgi:hypothetical protein